MLLAGCAADPATWRNRVAVSAAAAERGDYEQAELHAAEAERIAPDLGPVEEAETCVLRARLLREVGELDAAQDQLQKAGSLLESVETPTPRSARLPAELELERGRLALARGDATEARARFERAIREARRSEGQGSSAEGWALLGLGRSLRLQGETADARTALLRALAVHRGEVRTVDVRPASTIGVIGAFVELAALERTEDRLAPARAYALDAIRSGRDELGVSHPRLAPAWTELARIELAVGDVSAAREAALRADAITEERLPPRHAARLEAHATLARIEASAERSAEPR